MPYCENSELVTYLDDAGVPVLSLEVTHAKLSELNTSPTWESGCLY